MSYKISKKTFFFLISLLVLILISSNLYAFSGAYILKNDDTVFGFNQYYTIKDDKETLVELAIKYDLGYNEIVSANPQFDPWYPGKGKRVIIPTSWILPVIPDEYLKEDKQIIVINLAELRLYLIKKSKDKRYVITFPLGIGVEGLDTPTGSFRIIEKKKNPVWYVPESIRKEDPELPPFVPPGPDNPLGRYALRLSNPSYLIHGTNKPLGIGRRVSHGCIRMYPQDIEKLYKMVKIGDPVYILYQPVKIGKRNNIFYIEVEKSFNGKNLLQEAVNTLRKFNELKIDTRELYRLLYYDSLGFPVPLRKVLVSSR
jgi:L,D-transpeptidase ErfK/SrfK